MQYSRRSGVQFDSGSFNIRANPSAVSKNVQQSIPEKFTEGDSTRLSISRVKCLYRVPTSALPTAAVRSPIGSDFQFSAFALATSRLNWSWPLNTVPNGNRDSDAIPAEQIKKSVTQTFQLRMRRDVTERCMWKVTRSKRLEAYNVKNAR